MRTGTPPHWQEQGVTPDYRFSLANERTFLAWTRTALAILAGALVFHQISRHFHLGSWSLWAAVALTLVSALLAGTAFFRWRQCEIAMRMQRPLPASRLLPTVSTVLVMLSLAMAAWVATHP